MSKTTRLKTLAVSLALIIPLGGIAQATALQLQRGLVFAPSATIQHTQSAAFKDRKFYFSGREKLKRLLRPHSRRGNIITQDVRDATGDPNIVVFDQRGGGGADVYRCSYLTYRGKRALQCD